MTERPPNADELLENNRTYQETFADRHLSMTPTRRLAIVACMDSRMDIFAMLGLGKGEAHIIRNAGGVVTDDVIRSLCLSQRLLGTDEVILIHHTDCSLEKIEDHEFLEGLETDTGERPPWALGSFEDPYEDTVASIDRIRSSPFLPNRHRVRGFVYHTDTGELIEVAG